MKATVVYAERPPAWSGAAIAPLQSNQYSPAMFVQLFRVRLYYYLVQVGIIEIMTSWISIGDVTSDAISPGVIWTFPVTFNNELFPQNYFPRELIESQFAYLS